MNYQLSRTMKLKTTLAMTGLALAACSTINPPPDKSARNRISEELKQAVAVPQEKTASAVLPPSVSSSLLPPLRSGMPKTSSRQLEQRFDLVMTDAPINQVFMAIVSDTRYSILLSPKTVPPGPSAAASVQPAGQAVAGTSRATERMTVNLKDVTVFETLDAIRELYGYEYTVDGSRIYVQPPELKTSLYQVNYILGQRRGVSDLQVIGGASAGSSSGSSSARVDRPVTAAGPAQVARPVAVIPRSRPVRSAPFPNLTCGARWRMRSAPYWAARLPRARARAVAPAQAVPAVPRGPMCPM